MRDLRVPTSWSTGGREPVSAAASPDLPPPERHPILSATLSEYPSAPTTAGFAALGVPHSLVRVLTAQGITEPFPIQTATLPSTLDGLDVLGRGRTGSGKTLAFALPMVAHLTGARAKPGRPRGLILAPTRELANQIAATFEPLAHAVRLRVTTVYGGVSQRRQEQALAAGVDVMIACPGRLEDLLQQGVVSLADVEITVLDEADHMADLGFLPGVRRIMAATPPRGQRLLFSATLDRGVDQLVRQFMHDPVRHSVDSEESPVVAMTHHVFTVADVTAKRDVVQRLASGTGRRLLFTRTKHQAKKLAKQLTLAGIPAVDLHGNLSQPQRERNLAAFSDGTVRVMVATDIAARGIHVDDIELVVHVDPPAEHKAYLHRSGRTARAGSGGDVVTIVLPEQMGDVRALTRAAKITAQPTPVHAQAPHLVRLVGEIAPVVTPTAPPISGVRGGGERGGSREGGPGRPRGGRGRRGQGSGSGQRTGGAQRHGSEQRSGSAQRTGSAPAKAGRPAAAPGTASARGAAPAGARRNAAVELSMRGNAGRRRSR